MARRVAHKRETGTVIIDRDQLRRATFRVEKMDCAAEEQLVRMRLDALDSIQNLDVDLDQRTVSILHRGGLARIAGTLDGLRLGTTLIEESAGSTDQSAARPVRERRALMLALAINAVLFVGEFGAGILADSIGLVADSLDMLADASVYALSLFAVGRSAANKKQLAALSGYLQLGLALLGLMEVCRRFLTSDALPDPRIMVVVAAIALAGNVATLMVLQRARSEEAHFQASWIFTTNDIKVNALVIAAALVVAATDSATPDLVVGAVIFLIVANGARRILRLSR